LMPDERERRITLERVTRRRRTMFVALVAAALCASGWATNSEVAFSAPAALMQAGAVERNSNSHDLVAAVEPSALRSFGRLERRDFGGIVSVVAQLAVVPGISNARRYTLVSDLSPAISVRGLLAGDVAGRAPPAS
jgi:hypothetical protein